MTGFQLLQLMHQLVEVVVADGGLVQDVILVVMLVQFLSQLHYTLFLVHLSYLMTTFFPSLI